MVEVKVKVSVFRAGMGEERATGLLNDMYARLLQAEHQLRELRAVSCRTKEKVNALYTGDHGE